MYAAAGTTISPILSCTVAVANIHGEFFRFPSCSQHDVGGVIQKMVLVYCVTTSYCYCEQIQGLDFGTHKLLSLNVWFDSVLQCHYMTI